MEPTSTEEPIRLTWSDDRRTVVVTPEDQDRFVLTLEQAIEACKAYDPKTRTRCKKAFDLLLTRLGDWLRMHAGNVSRAFLTRRDANLLFLVIMKGRKRDDELEGELTDIDLQIARDDRFSDFSVSALAIPQCDEQGYLSFIDPEFWLEYKGIE